MHNDNSVIAKQEALKQAVETAVTQTSRARGKIALAVANATKNYEVDKSELLKIIKGRI